MKSLLLIGMGQFGHHLAKKFIDLGNEVMVVDNEESKISDLINVVTAVKIADCTNPEVLESFGLSNFDIVFICIGTNFQSSLEITSLVKEKGAKWVVSKATRDIQAKFLMKNGADDVVYPDKDMAQKCAARYSVNHIFDYIELTKGYAIYEIRPLKHWVGKSIKSLEIRTKYNISILGIKKGEDRQIMPDPSYIIKADEHLIVLSADQDISKILKRKYII